MHCFTLVRSYDREVRSKAQVQLSYTEEATEKNRAQKGAGHCETGRTPGMGEGLEGEERKKNVSIFVPEEKSFPRTEGETFGLHDISVYTLGYLCCKKSFSLAEKKPVFVGAISVH